MSARLAFRAFVLLVPLVVAACGDNPNVRGVSRDEYMDYQQEQGSSQGKLLGDNGLVFGIGKGAGGGGGGGGAPGDGAALGVNAYLWRGALDTLAFMPLASADPFGGVIITDWYQPPASPGERFKATAYILGRQLRADGIRVSIFRQVAQNGTWVDASVSQTTTADIENKVLARARELRAQTASR